MGVILTHHVTDDTGALLVRLVGRIPELIHPEEDPAVDRLEAVAHVR